MQPSTPSPKNPATPTLRVVGLVALLVTGALLVRHARQPPAPRAISAPAPEFAAMRAMRHLGVIAQRPHPIGSPDASRVRTYIMATLDSLGLTTEVQEVTAVGTRYQALGHVRNIVGRLNGTSPGGPAVLLMSHYDGVPAGPAASDAGSGVSVILEVLRAVRAGAPLTHDVIVLVTDGEESGLLGASAFVREHRWTKDVAVTLNFEARGTGGRAAMFETGPGNLDLVRVLRGTPDVTASSLIVTIYRTLNNDTDLSEVSRLERPALNFAYVDDVARYHTTEDDTLHIDPGSMQQEGAQALALVRALGVGPLPRAITTDAVFTDFAPFGLVYYGEGLAKPLAIVLVVMFVIATLLLRGRAEHWLRETLIGVVLTLVSLGVGGGLAAGAGAIATQVHSNTGGAAAFATSYVMALVALALAGALACWSLARRWSSEAGLHHGVLLVWTVLAVAASLRLPGGSYVVVWPLAVALLASIVVGTGRVGRTVTAVIAAYVALAVLVPMIAAYGPVMLGVIGMGGIMTGVLVALLSGIIAPQLEWLLAARTHRLAAISAAVGVAAMVTGAVTVRATAAHPVPSMLAYVADADSGEAWLTAPTATAGPTSWAAGVLGPTMRTSEPGNTRNASGMPAWLATALPFGGRIAARQVPRVTLAGPVATVVSDSTTTLGRTLVLRITAPPGALAANVRVPGQRVRSAAVDGRIIDTTRFRRRQDDWAFRFSAPPDSGFTIALTLAPGPATTVQLASIMAGLPSMPGVPVPPRSAGTVIVQMGDVTVVRRQVVF